MTPPSPSISAAFTAHKTQILSSLARPDNTYTDLSPKGSIDTPIRDLIDEINSLDGLVTTSSCSGRVSIFVEGRKATSTSTDPDTEYSTTETRQRIVPGGKGFDGRWLYVSHDPLPTDGNGRGVLMPEEIQSLLDAQQAQGGVLSMDPASTRLIHLSFEPLILHISSAGLTHAKPILALALDAGFRESGLQSLKCLDNAHAWPMVAIRSAGVAFSTVIGMVDDQGRERLIVGKEYLALMLGVCNERFVENRRRTERVRDGVRRLVAGQRKVGDEGEDVVGESGWEDRDVRAARKRAEGLKVRDALRRDGGEERRRDLLADDGLVGFGGEMEA